MFLPPVFREQRNEVIHDLMRAHPLATLVVNTAGGLCANHLPLVLHEELGERGILRGHVARPNPVWRDMENGHPALAIFHGPQAYVSPGWYPSKSDHGRVVPTWNYMVVHAHGLMSAIEDKDWLKAHLETLVARHETGRDPAWALNDAPENYIARQLNGIVGLELDIARIEGKWKVSQNRPKQDRLGVIEGLENESGQDASAIAQAIPRD
jgi:transcriptional regulator